MNIVAITGMDLTSMQNEMPQDLKERCQFHWFKSSSEAGEHIQMQMSSSRLAA